MPDVPAAVPATPSPAAPAVAPPPVAAIPAAPALAVEKISAAAVHEQALRRQEHAIREEAAKLQAARQEYEQNKARIKTDPIAFLEAHGVPFNELVDTMVARQPPKPGDEVKALKAQFEAYQKAQSEEVARLRAEQQQRDLAEWQAQVVAHVDGQRDKYELIHAYGAAQAIPQLIAEYSQTQGKQLTFDEAAELVENQLQQQVERVLATKKAAALAKKSEAPPANAPPPGDGSKPKADAQSLSNSATGSTAAMEAARAAAEKQLTPQQRRAIAIAMLEGKPPPAF
jgi:hypothetical protein